MKKEKVKNKKRFLRKRNIILAIVLLVIVSLTANFFVSCGNDEFETTPDVETITSQSSTMLKNPTDGTKPSDYDAKTNIYYALYAMNALDSFTTESSGDTSSKVALVSVSQKIKGRRVVNGNKVYKENVSHSSFKSVGAITYVNGENYVIHNASEVSSINDAVWEKTASRVLKEDFLEKFGYVPNSITGYLLTDETILSAEYLGEKNGIYSYYLDLDTIKSTGMLALEMRTMAGSNSLPLFDKASITVRMNKKWQVTEVVTSSIYSVNILGGVTCTENVTEKFSNFNKSVKIPNEKFYSSYVDAEITQPAPETLSATDYLMAGFSDYITGTKPLKFSASLTATELSASLDGIVNVSLDSLENLALRVNLKELTYQDVSLNDVLVSYENSNVYLKKGDFKAKTTINELTGALSSITSLLGANSPVSLSGLDLSSLDLASLLTGATLVETTTQATITLPLKFGETKINAQIVLSKGDKITVKSISATIGELALNLTISDSVVVEEKGNGYNAITPLLSLIKENVNLSVSFGEISAQVSANLKTYEINAYMQDLSFGGANVGDVKVKLLNGVVYANVLGLKAKLNLDDVNGVLDKLSFVPLTLPAFDLSAISDISIAEILPSVMSSLSINSEQNKLNVNLNVLGYDVNVILSVNENGYNLEKINTLIDGTPISIAPINSVPTISNFELDSYNNIATLLDIIENNEINLSVNALGFDIALNVNLTDFTILAKTTIYGETLTAKLFDNKVYVSYKGLNAYVDINDIEGVLAKLGAFVGEIELPDISSLSNVSLESIINGLNITETDVITIATEINGIDVNVILDKTNGLKVSSITAIVDGNTITATPSIKADYSALENKTFYNAVTLLDIIENNEINLSVNALGFDIALNINLTDFTILAKTTIYGETLTAKLFDNKVYVSYKGLNAYVDLADIDNVLDKLGIFVGNIELPDFSNITIESIISSLTITETDVITITTDINGIDIAIVLDKTNGLKVASVNLAVEDIEISATPSVKADYSGMNATNYYNLVTLLDIIENNEVNLSVNAFDLDIDLSVNLTDFTILAKTTLYGETLYAKLFDNKVYLSYKGLNAYVDLADIDNVLDKLGIFVGDIELPDFSNITIENIINGLTITETDVITISTEINGIDLSVILDKTNGLKVNSVSAKVEDIEISAIPSVKADYSGMSNGNYYNLVTLLDVIDENGKINVTANVFNLDVYATIDLVNSEILVKVDDFEILVSLLDNTAYARYPGAIAKLNLNDINFILNELKPLITRFITEEEFNSIDVNALKNISIEDIISSISVTEYESVINVNVSLSCIVANITLNKAQNGLNVTGGTIIMDAIELPFTLTNEVLNLTFDKTLEYIDLTSVVENLAPALRNILTLDNLYANMTATLTTGNKIYNLTKCEVLITNIYSTPRARVSLALTISTVNPDGTITQDSRHEIELYYLDPSLVAEGAINTYFTYNDMTNAEDVFAGSFTTVNFYETLEIVKQLYFNMPELQDALKPFIVPDENGMPKFMDLNVKFNELINSALFTNGTFMLDLNGKAVMPDLGSSMLVNLFAKNGLLCLDLEEFKLRDTLISLDARVGEAPSGVITEDKFSFTPASNTQDFSSINELLLALEKTSEKRHFYIDANIDLTGASNSIISWLSMDDKVLIDLYLDVIDGKTYFKAVVERKDVNLVVMNVWSDKGGTSYIYFDPDEQIIYVHNHYIIEQKDVIGSLFGRPIYGLPYKVERDEYLKYTVEEFSKDPLNIIFEVLHVSNDLKDLINSETSKEKVNTATIENTLTGYNYNGTDMFTISLDLAPLTTDIKTTTLKIKHDSEFNLTNLNASVNMIDIISLNLDATLTTSTTSYGTDIEAKAQASNSNYN